jgi:hypothetical protein
MKLHVVTTQPAQEIAAEPGTLDHLTASLRKALTERFGEPVTTAEIGNYGGFPLVTDDRLLPGIVHFRPTGHRTATEDELRQLLAWFDLRLEAGR